MAADGDSIVARMTSHYGRQIAWVEASIAALDAMSAMPLDADWDGVVQEDAGRAAELKSLEAEYLALRKEWDATPAFLPAERNHVRHLADQFAKLAVEFQRKLDGLAAKFAEAGGAAQQEMGVLRKARDVVQKFSAGSPRGGGFVDRQA
jgi:hypothetical protein